MFDNHLTGCDGDVVAPPTPLLPRIYVSIDVLYASGQARYVRYSAKKF